MVRLLALAVVSAALVQPAAACPRPNLVDVPLTRDGTNIPAGGGVVIATINGPDRGASDGRLVAGRDNIEQKREYVAPGLTVVVAKPQANRAIEFVGLDGKALLKLTQGPVAARHAPPKLVAVKSTLPPPPKGDAERLQVYEPSGQLSVELGDAPPDDVIALVLSTGGQGFAWLEPQKGQKTYTLYVGGKRCVPGPGGVAQGTAVTAAWLDTTGRMSAATKAVRVGTLETGPGRGAR
jgi:hypothetical protein